MPRTTPCLWFDGNAEEAAEYYVSMFPNSRIGTIERIPEDNPFPVDLPPGAALTIDFELDGQPYTALNGGPLFTFSEAISFMIECADQDEIDHYYDGFVRDGGAELPCGWVKDRFGLSWQVVPVDLHRWAADPVKSAKVMQALSTMTKLDLAALRAAAGEA
jgi:predicted 3-demethylubiquinone-9 3-methyltransferase (glyoxalase superfamily)